MRCTVHLTLIISVLGDRAADKRLSSATVLYLSVARRVWGEQLTAPLRWTFHANGQASLTQTYFYRHSFCACHAPPARSVTLVFQRRLH